MINLKHNNNIELWLWCTNYARKLHCSVYGILEMYATSQVLTLVPF
uniref:Uncharacterized protein n=1 Tax=Rhizophora mucronata TaxID=61149 RepID=A0A2P2NES7_RHIMU